MKEFDPKHAAQKGYTREDWQAVDSAPLTDAELKSAKPLEQALPKVAQKMATEVRRRGRPKSSITKQSVSLRLDADLVTKLRESGKGWQTRVNEILRRAVDLEE